MTTGMTIAILIFLVWGVVQVFRWTFSDDKDKHEWKGPFKPDEDDKGDKDDK